MELPPRRPPTQTKNIVYLTWDGVITNTQELIFNLQRDNPHLSSNRPYDTVSDMTEAITGGKCSLFENSKFLQALEEELEKHEPVFFDDALKFLETTKAAGYEIVIIGDGKRSRIESEAKKLGFEFDDFQLGFMPEPDTSGEVFLITSSSKQCDAAHSHFGDLQQPAKVLSITRHFEPAQELEHHHSIACNSLQDAVDYITYPSTLTGKSYLFSGYYGCERLQLHKKLRGWDLVAGRKYAGKKVDYVRHEHTKDGSRDKSLYGLDCTLKNVLDEEGLRNVTNKQLLYRTMRNRFEDYRKFMPQTWNLKDVRSVKEGEVLIIKPVGYGACAGNGISVVTDDDGLRRAREKISKDPRWKEAIASNYITNPLLFKGRKFHFRCYILITSWGKYIPYRRADILTASEPYKAADYDNEAIHDSHGKSTLEDRFFPEDLPDPEGKIQAGLTMIFDRIIEAIKKDCTLKTYSESQHGYELLAPDILFDEDFNPYLLEVNSRVGYGAVKGVNEYYHEWERGFLDWEYEHGIAPIFDSPHNKQ